MPAPACSYLINASRGQVVDLASLAEAIRSGRVAGTAVDVYPTEPETNSDGFLTGAHLQMLWLRTAPAGRCRGALWTLCRRLSTLKPGPRLQHHVLRQGSDAGARACRKLHRESIDVHLLCL